MHWSVVPIRSHVGALQQTPFLQEPSAQATWQVEPPQVTCPSHVPASQVTRVSSVASLTTPFWHDGIPLHATTQSVVLPEQLTLPEQLPLPLQRTSH